LLNVGKDVERKAIVGVVIGSIGFIFILLSDLILAPSWKDVLRLYFHLDAILPTLISTIIAISTEQDFLGMKMWYSKVLAFTIPLWIVYFVGSLRVVLAYGKWQRWQVIFYKFIVVGCGLANFYVGFVYMRGGYKITNGYFRVK
jgi:hypothetical protein